MKTQAHIDRLTIMCAKTGVYLRKATVDEQARYIQGQTDPRYLTWDCFCHPVRLSEAHTVVCAGI